MFSMGLGLASSLPNSVKSKMYTTGLTFVPPPYNLLFDNLCFVYRHLDNSGENDKKKLQEKINRLIEVAPIPSKSQLTASVKMAADVCEFKDMAINDALREKIKLAMPKIYQILDEIIKIAPSVGSSSMNMEDIKKQMTTFSGIIAELKNAPPVPANAMSGQHSPATPAETPTIQSNFKKIEENIYKLKNMKGGTGLFTETDEETAFATFAENCTFSYLAYGSNGLILKGNLNPNAGIQSPYKSMEDGKPVNQILLKLTAINIGTNNHNAKVIYANPDDGKKQSIIYQTINEFTEEINIQTNVFIQSSEYLQPICPTILTAICVPSKTLKTYLKNVDANARQMINAIFATSEDDAANLDEVHNENKAHYVGINAMEYMKNMTTLTEFIDETTKLAMGMYLLIEFAVKYGYFHGDSHCGNILIDSTRTDYFTGIPGYPILIDFGYATKLPPKIYNRIKELYNSKKYVELLNVFGDIPRKDWLDLGNYPQLQILSAKTRYISNTVRKITSSPDDKKYLQSINATLNVLYAKRKQAINEVIEKTKISMPEIHLPLTSKVKNKMYNGMRLVMPIAQISINMQVIKQTNLLLDWLYNIIVDHNKLFSRMYRRKQNEYITDSDTPEPPTPYANRINELEQGELNRKDMRDFIRMTYMLIHILGVEENISNSNLQTLGSVAFLLSNLSHYYTKPLDKIVYYSSNAVKVENLYKYAEKYFPIVSNVEYDSIDRYFSLTKLCKLSKTELLGILKNPETYENPGKVASEYKSQNSMLNITRKKEKSNLAGGGGRGGTGRKSNARSTTRKYAQ